MRSISKINQKRALTLAITLALSTSAALAGTSSTQLPNGANLGVTITSPVTSTEFLVPHTASDIDVAVVGSASIGEGEPNVTLVYVVDVSGSTTAPCGADNILECEKQAVLNINSGPNIDSVKWAGVAVYGAAGAPADMTPGGADDPITAQATGSSDVETVVNSIHVASGDCGVSAFIHKDVGCGATNFSAGLANSLPAINASDSSTEIVIFMSDGQSNIGGGSFNANLADLEATGAVIHSFAVGAGSSCGGGNAGTLQEMADATGGSCTTVADPANLPDILPDLLSSWLDTVSVNGVAATTVAALPIEGPDSTDYTSMVLGLIPGDQIITAEATGHDNSASDSVSHNETIHVMQLAATPETEDNDLNDGNSHMVIGRINGGITADPEDMTLDFAVSGHNAAVATPADSTINPVNPNVDYNFSYSVPQECASLGTDTIDVTVTLSDGESDVITLTKNWIDETPPSATCEPSVNPHGNEPQAPGKGGKGQNQDGFYKVNALDPTLDCAVTLTLTDGDGHEFPGPFNLGDTVKYTENSGPVKQKTMGSDNGSAGSVAWHLKGHGDLVVTATDTSGNVSDPVQCLVPPKPQ